MQSIIQNSNIMEAISEEFKGEYFYGLTLVLDEIYDTEDDILTDNDEVDIDWFGLTDDCVY